MSPLYPELGFYTLPGHVFAPNPIFQEMADADRIGLGSCLLYTSDAADDTR
jgi:hypothetical protein